MFRFAFVTAVCVATLLLGSAHAHDFSVGSLKIDHPWARATPKGASIGGGYIKITNNGSTPDRFIGGVSDVSKRFEIHEMTMENGIMRMRQMLKGIEIKPGETLEFKPGSYHVMFVGLAKPLEQGQHINATIEFEKAGKVQVYFQVESIGAQSSGADHAKPDMGSNHGGAHMKH